MKTTTVTKMNNSILKFNNIELKNEDYDFDLKWSNRWNRKPISVVSLFVVATKNNNSVYFTMEYKFDAGKCIEYEKDYSDGDLVPYGSTYVRYNSGWAVENVKIKNLPEPVIYDIDYPDAKAKELLDLDNEGFEELKKIVIEKAKENIAQKIEEYIEDHADILPEEEEDLLI